jgi:hypothetical protein
MKKTFFAVVVGVSLVMGGSAWSADVTVLDRCIVGDRGSICGAEYLRLEAINEMRGCAGVLRQIAGLVDAEMQAVVAAGPQDSRSGSANTTVKKRYFDATAGAMARALGRVQNAHECRVGAALVIPQ